MKKPVVLLAAVAIVLGSGLIAVPQARADGQPSVSVTVVAVTAGSPLGVTADGFWPQELVAFSLSGLQNKDLGGIVADIDGTVNGQLPVLLPASMVAGSYSLSAVGKSSGLSAKVKVTMVSRYHLLRFDVNGGSGPVASRSAMASRALGSLPSPTRAGYSFKGWFTARSGGTKVSSSSKMGSYDKTVYAHWTGKKYTVKFNANGGKSPKLKSKKATMGKAYGKLAVSSRTRYTFLGWFTAKSGGVKVSSTTKFSKAASQTLYAHWRGKSYTVKLNPQSGAVSSKSVKVTYGATYKILPTPTRSGYNFVGWYTKASGGSKVTNNSKVKITKTQTLYAHWSKAVGSYVNLPDPRLKACVANALKVSNSASITIAQAQKLQVLDCNGYDIQSFSGLSSFTGLTTLDLTGNRMTTLSVLSGLTKLTSLRAESNFITDISTVATFKNLTVLDLSMNQITDASAIAGLTNLTELDLNGNSISSISTFTGLTKLTVLELVSTNIPSISALEGMTRLYWLDLGGNQIFDVSPLRDLTSLTVLSLDSNQISDLSSLSGLTNIAQADFSNNQISDLDALSSWTKLENLYLSRNEIIDVRPLANLTSLDSLDLAVNQISDVSSLASLPQLSSLWLDGNQICDKSQLDYSYVSIRGLEWGDQTGCS